MKKIRLKKALLASAIAMILSHAENVNAEENIMDKYLDEQIKFYKEHPEAIAEDAEKYEIVIDSRGKAYTQLVSHSIEDVKSEFGDIAYIPVTSVGNAASTGDRKFTKNFDDFGLGIGYKPVAVVGVKSNAEYPFAVAEYDKETNTVGDIIGWFKDEDVYARFDNYSEVIEMPISKYITYGNIFDFDIDENGHLVNHSYMLPYDYTPLDENYRHGLKIGYSQEEKDGYYSSYSEGLYVSEEKESLRAKLDSKNLELVLKFNIRNN